MKLDIFGYLNRRYSFIINKKDRRLTNKIRRLCSEIQELNTIQP